MQFLREEERMKVKLKYKLTTIIIEFLFGLAWIVLGFLKLNLNTQEDFFIYLSISLGAASIILALYRLFFHYGIIENGILKKNILFTKNIKLEEIEILHTNDKEYFVETKEGKEYPIKVSKLSKKSKKELDDILSTLKLEVKSY